MRLRYRLALLCLCARAHPSTGASGAAADGRHSFSLSTFDPAGKLGQVERAHAAASLGPPLVAVVVVEVNSASRAVLMAAPQELPSTSALVEDDGTSRFLRLTSEIVVGHTGLSADGRFLLARAKKLAIQHEYAFDEPIPVAVLLEELALLYQQYTMRPAARPLGAYLMVAHLPGDARARPSLFRLDPSGNVHTIRDDVVVLNGNLEKTQLRGAVEEMLRSADAEGLLDHLAEGVVVALRDSVREQSRRGGRVPRELASNEGGDRDPLTVIVATLSAPKYTTRRFD
jgi:20S proteasome subunit alpha 2